MLKLHSPWHRRPGWRALQRAALLALLAPLLLAGLAGCGDEPERPKRVHTVKLLPDTPPPPPPPPKPDDKPPPPKAEKEAAPQPKAEQPPEQQALRSDEAAGTGPGSGLVAGAVTQDYTDQKIGQAATRTGGESVGVNRLAANAYASSITRALNDYLARERELKQRDFRVPVSVWLEPDGRIQRVELLGSTGDDGTDQTLRSALTRFPGTGTPLPERMPQPMRLQVSNRMIG